MAIPPVSPATQRGWPQVPGYVLLEELGRGGMGVVFKARQVKLNRIVALKMIRSGALASAEELARFRTEAEAVARIQHPNIVQIYEVGEVDDLPFFSLEFVAGGSLARRLNGTPLCPDHAAKLVEVLARAVHAAHERGIVHRDLKPVNILLASGVREFSFGVKPTGGSRPPLAEFTPKITDFGLAKQMEQSQGPTASGAILGTPSYMAPEQAMGQGKQIGPATDVYALGAILYEMLTGRPPFKAETPMATIFQVITQEPVPPSRLQPQVPASLETICLKCLQKEPKSRYRSAEELAQELAQAIPPPPVPDTLADTAPLVRNRASRGLAVALGVALAALVVTLGFAIFQFAVTNDLRSTLDETRDQQRQAEQNVDNLQNELLRTHDLLRRHETTFRRQSLQFAENALDRALLLCATETTRDQGLLWLARALEDAPRDASDLQWAIRANLAAWQKVPLPLKAASLNAAIVKVVAFSPDGKAVVTGSGDDKSGEARVWSTTTGKELTPPLRHKREVTAVAFSPDGKAVLTGSGGYNDKEKVPWGEARLWSVATGEELSPRLQPKNQVLAVAFSPDGKAILTGGGFYYSSGQAQLWSAANGQELTNTLDHRGKVRAVAFSPDGKAVLTGGGDVGDFTGEARLWSVATGKELSPPMCHQGLVTAVAFRPGGKGLLTVTKNPRLEAGEVWLWSPTSGEPLGPPLPHRDLIRAVAFTSDGRAFLTGSDAGTARLWSAATKKQIGPALRHQDPVIAVRISPDGKTMFTMTNHKTVTLWPVPVPVAGGPERITLAVQILTGKELDDDGIVRVLDAKTLQDRRRRLEELGGQPFRR
jgi:serine/threonine protein kinase/WD40 repeat protein